MNPTAPARVRSLPQIDSERLKFLRQLRDSGVKLNEWEKKFVADRIRFSETAPAFTDPQRRTIDRLYHKHGRLM